MHAQENIRKSKCVFPHVQLLVYIHVYGAATSSHPLLPVFRVIWTIATLPRPMCALLCRGRGL